MKKLYFLPAVMALAAFIMFGQGSGAFFGIQTAFGYGGGGGGGGGSFSLLPSNNQTHITGDFNHDGKIDISDLNTLMVNWGTNPTNLSADLNGDGKVDIIDFNLLMVNWVI